MLRNETCLSFIQHVFINDYLTDRHSEYLLSKTDMGEKIFYEAIIYINSKFSTKSIAYD